MEPPSARCACVHIHHIIAYDFNWTVLVLMALGFFDWSSGDGSSDIDRASVCL